MLDLKLMKERLKDLKWDYAKLSEITNVSISTIGKIFSGITTNPTNKNLAPILTALDLKLEDVDSDLASFKNETDYEYDNLFKDYSKLNPRQKQTIRDVLKSQLNMPTDHQVRSLIHFDEPACAGYGNTINEPNYQIIERPDAPITAQYTTNAQGDSMDNDNYKESIKDGQLLYVNPNAQPCDNEIWIVVYQGSTFVKLIKYQNNKIILRSLNPKYKDIVVNNIDELYFQGRVL